MLLGAIEQRECTCLSHILSIRAAGGGGRLWALAGAAACVGNEERGERGGQLAGCGVDGVERLLPQPLPPLEHRTDGRLLGGAALGHGGGLSRECGERPLADLPAGLLGEKRGDGTLDDALCSVGSRSFELGRRVELTPLVQSDGAEEGEPAGGFKHIDDRSLQLRSRERAIE